jgi:TolA-binding protein
MKKLFAVLLFGLAAALFWACEKRETPDTAAETVAAAELSGGVTVTSELAGIVLIDGTETGKRVKANGTVTIDGVQNGDTEVAVKADDGTIVRAAEVVLVKAGEMATVTIKAPADQTKTVETPPPVTEPAATAQAATKQATAPAQTNAKQTATPAQTTAKQTAPPDNSVEADADYTEEIIFKIDYMTYYEQGNAYMDEGEFDKAIANYTQAIRLKSDYVEAYYVRGLAYYSNGAYDSAIADLTQVNRSNPDFAEAYYVRGIDGQAASGYIRKLLLQGENEMNKKTVVIHKV